MTVVYNIIHVNRFIVLWILRAVILRIATVYLVSLPFAVCSTTFPLLLDVLL